MELAVVMGKRANYISREEAPVFLKEGDVIELGIERLGTARQEVRAWPGIS